MAKVSLTVELVCSHTYGKTLHFRTKGEYRTFCGRDAEDWPFCRMVEFEHDLASAYTCKRCINAI